MAERTAARTTIDERAIGLLDRTRRGRVRDGVEHPQRRLVRDLALGRTLAHELVDGGGARLHRQPRSTTFPTHHLERAIEDELLNVELGNVVRAARTGVVGLGVALVEARAEPLDGCTVSTLINCTTHRR